jgi:hypothetical protein
MIFKFLPLFILVSCSTSKSVEEKFLDSWKYRPSFQGLVSDSENSTMSMNCRGEPPFNEMNCRFNTSWIEGRPGEKSLMKWSTTHKKEYMNKLDEIFSSAEKLKKFEQALKENEAYLKEMEDYYQKLKLNIYKKKYEKLYDKLAVGNYRCMDQKTKELKKTCLLEHSVKMMRLRNNTCSLKNHETGYYTFNKTESNKWVSTFEYCRTRTTRTLVFTGQEKDWDKKRPENWDWIFSEDSIEIAIDPKMKKMCEDLQPITQSKKYEFFTRNYALMKCDVIHFDQAP